MTNISTISGVCCETAPPIDPRLITLLYSSSSSPTGPVQATSLGMHGRRSVFAALGGAVAAPVAHRGHTLRFIVHRSEIKRAGPESYEASAIKAGLSYTTSDRGGGARLGRNRNLRAQIWRLNLPRGLKGCRCKTRRFIATRRGEHLANGY